MEHRMSKALSTIAILLVVNFMPGASSAKGCLKGAAFGGVVGHVAGHHGVAGAAAGCVIGHHRAKTKASETSETQRQDNAARASGAAPAR
jgi:hypothetical protein